MKKNLTVLLAILASLSSAAHADSGNEPSERFWQEIRELVLRCSVQPVMIRGNRRIAAPVQSRCADLRVKAEGAEFILNNARYVAYLEESENSDGGDLYSVHVLNGRGQKVAARSDVPAFGDILLGLAGGSHGLREERIR